MWLSHLFRYPHLTRVVCLLVYAGDAAALADASFLQPLMTMTMPSSHCINGTISLSLPTFYTRPSSHPRPELEPEPESQPQPVDCVGAWSVCGLGCASKRFTVSVASTRGGIRCTEVDGAVRPCTLGEGACRASKNTTDNCTGVWAECTVACETAERRVWLGSGSLIYQLCPPAVSCKIGDGGCVAPAYQPALGTSSGVVIVVAMLCIVAFLTAAKLCRNSTKVDLPVADHASAVELTENPAARSAEADSAPFSLFVRTLNAQEYQFSVSGSDLIETLKLAMYEKSGVPPEEQRLIHNGIDMADVHTVAHYGIVQGTVLHLVLRLADRPTSEPLPKPQPGAAVRPGEEDEG